MENHALLWENGAAIDLGNLGGTGAIAGNHACALNNRGQVVGHSELPNDTTFHGFVWTSETHMRDLGTLPGDFASLALGINNSGEVVGASLASNFNSRAVVWDNGVIADLNSLIPANSKLILQFAFSINSSGQIVGVEQTTRARFTVFWRPRADNSLPLRHHGSLVYSACACLTICIPTKPRLSPTASAPLRRSARSVRSSAAASACLCVSRGHRAIEIALGRSLDDLFNRSAELRPAR